MKGTAAEKVSSTGLVVQIKGATTGTIARIDKQGSVWVDFPRNPSGPIQARLTGAMADRLASSDVQKLPPVLLAFEENDPGRPVIVDVICETVPEPSPLISIERKAVDDVRIDGQTITFDAAAEIVLRCGKSSITLTQAGKVLIRGAYLLNRSSGVNLIRGGSVQIN